MKRKFYLGVVEQKPLNMVRSVEISAAQVTGLYAVDLETISREIGIHGGIFESRTTFLHRYERAEATDNWEARDSVEEFRMLVKYASIDSYVILTNTVPGKIRTATLAAGARLTRT